MLALGFIKDLNQRQKDSLGFYFCSDDDFLDKLEEQNEDNKFGDYIPMEEGLKETGKEVQKLAPDLSKNNIKLASHLINELIHLQDIFSTKDITNWDASSITTANENFEMYARNQVLIPIPINEFDYWTKLLGASEDDEEGDDDEED